MNNNSTLDEIRSAVADGITAALSDPAIHCRYGISPDDHMLQHEALKGFISFTDRVNGIKWKTFQTLVIFIVMALFGLMLFGAAVKIRLLTFMGLG